MAVFLNNGNSTTSITCDQTCFSQMGFDSSLQLEVRDLWLHEVIRTITATQFTMIVDGL